MAGIGSVAIFTNLTLNSVLLVPNLDCNLLSISKLSADHDCVVKFSQNQCEFQDRISGKTIGSAEVCSGLYILQGLLPAISLLISTIVPPLNPLFVSLIFILTIIVQSCYGTID